MDNFRAVTLFVALGALILILTITGVLLARKGSNKVYPPVYMSCPDYWTYDPDSNMCKIPPFGLTTSLNLGGIYDKGGKLLLNATNTPGLQQNQKNEMVIDFKDKNWKGACSMKTWSNNNGIVWDGISNYNAC